MELATFPVSGVEFHQPNREHELYQTDVENVHASEKTRISDVSRQRGRPTRRREESLLVFVINADLSAVGEPFPVFPFPQLGKL